MNNCIKLKFKRNFISVSKKILMYIYVVYYVNLKLRKKISMILHYIIYFVYNKLIIELSISFMFL